ncbi:hypothetical protein A3860_12745 [Niastella vici]|uniref:Glycosyltransferase RgtA/B/C/D-like domain-containing protein n=1 Tax=Niastella vici TaxID=1703345 RepID=A0A1V9G6W4_9BACT|nr:hypothetical protein [Niastella vici]OQP66363.1 hypothetical protein A3860_12745 [Niastella vici]
MSKLSSWFNLIKNNIRTGHSKDAESFSRFLFKNADNKRYLDWGFAAIIIQFVIFKLCYPFADFFADSYTYINAAAHHHNISFRPIGYSRFLEGIHWVTTSDTSLTFIQYFIIQAGALTLFFTIRYFYPLRKVISNIMFIVLVFNPANLYISNYICSDAVYIGLCLIWFSLLLWIINRPAWIQLILLSGLMFLIFTLRFAAIFLPAIALFALLLSNRNLLFKLTGTVLMVLPISLTVQYIKNITAKETGIPIFSAFGSWMSMNNALHMYPYIKVQDADLPSTDCKELNRIVKQYFNSHAANKPYPTLTFDYLWALNSPLKEYQRSVQASKKISNYFCAWHAVAPVFSQYSNSLSLQHPAVFAHYYLWPNIKWYCLPPLESFIIYNVGNDTVDSVAIKWFRYKGERVTCINKTIQATILQPQPYWFLLVNIICCGALAVVLVKAKRYALPPALLRTLLLAGGFWIVNFCFSIYAAPIVFRFELFPAIVFTAFSLLLIDRLLKKNTHHSALQ